MSGHRFAALVFVFMSLLILASTCYPVLVSIDVYLERQAEKTHNSLKRDYERKLLKLSDPSAEAIVFKEISELATDYRVLFGGQESFDGARYLLKAKKSVTCFTSSDGQRVLMVVPAGDEVYYSFIARSLYFLLLLVNSLALLLLLLGRKKKKVNASSDEESVGPYIIRGELGVGAMGKVYKANHKMMHRPVALKVLSQDSSFSSDFLFFEREAQMTSQLTHPNTIAIYDYGKTDEGVFYYAMEYLEGIDLQQIVHLTGPQCAARVIHIALQICGSLAEAHKEGLIHRDIKSNNIFLCVRGGIYDYVKVLDFGLVKDMNAFSSSLNHASKTVKGTPCFISPEAIQTPSQVDQRSDIYSLGVTLYHLLTGKYPFKGDSIKDVLEMQLGQDPVLPSELVRFGIPGDLERLIMSCMAKDPNLRPQNMEELEKSLKACVDYDNWRDSDAYHWWGINRDFFSKDSHWIPEIEQAERYSSTVILDKKETVEK